MAKLSVIIPAAGSGVRLGSPIPKPFIELGEKTIIEHTLTKFLQVPNLVQVIIATSERYFPKVESIISTIETSSVNFTIVEGAEERQFSIFNALQKVTPEADLVAVHDAVRPFVSVTQIESCCRAAQDYGGAVLGVPAKDTIKQVKANAVIEKTPNRALLWQAQTPQVFRKELLVQAYKKAMEAKFVGTDDASLVERIGGVVHMVKGDRENLKITYPIDLKIAELILGEQNEKD